MGKVTLKCPSCGGDVQLGDVECPHCGVNLKSGESFETRVKKARGKARHPEHFGRGLYVSVILAFGLITFAGFMYQRLVEKTLVARWDTFQYAVLKMQEIEDTVAVADRLRAQGHAGEAQKKYEEARQAANELISWLAAEAEKIKPREPYSGQQKRSWRGGTGPEYNRRVAKSQLNNLKRKAEALLESIPAA